VPQEIIVLENVFYSYPREKTWALENISLSITEGEFLAVMGKNGAGKTTFCKLINGIIPHSCGGRLLGTVTVDGECTAETPVPQLARKVGMALDDPDAQLFTSSVRNEAAFGPENLMLPPDEIEKRVERALNAVGLSGFEEREPKTLSGGEKQRLAIAAALAMPGKILVLDEPLARLDPAGASQFLSVLRSVREKFKLTVIMATHDSAGTAGIADRICVLNDGRIAACDIPQKIFANSALLRDNGMQPPVNTDINEYFLPAGVGFYDTDTKSEAIRITGLSYFYDSSKASIKKINLSVKNNDFMAIIGRNGCGKTTLLKNIAGLLRPCSGEIYINGKNSKELSIPAISKEAGFVMQNPDNQLFTDSVYNEVSFALKNSELSKTEKNKRVEAALCAVGLENPDAFPHALSRADRTKTVIASVLAMGCKIIILDEVDVGQDFTGIVKIMNLVRELHSQGFTVIFVTHNMYIACEYAERLVIMENDGIVMDGKRKGAAK
jgi:energy-coupling factor transport system ATP-binding protein